MSWTPRYMKYADRAALDRFKQLCDRIQEATQEDHLYESDKQKAERIKALLAHYPSFVKYYFPHYATAECGDFHIKAANRIRRRKHIRAVLKWARGHAKSTHATIMIPLWLKALKELKVMVLVGKNEKAAQTLLSDLQAELQFNQRYINDFGMQFSYGSWEEGHCVTQDDCAFFALGRGQSPRGIRHRQFRPDYIVMDDCDDDQLCRNPRRVKEAFKWSLEALLGTMDMGRGRFIVVGNMISRNSLIASFSENEDFWVQTVNALDEKGGVTWHQKYTREEIERMIKTLGWRSAQKEFFNNPIVEGGVFQPEWIHYRKPLPLKEYKARLIYCDPSFKATGTSDFKAIVFLGLRQDMTVDVLHAFLRRCSVNHMVNYWYDFAFALPDNVAVRHYIEANFTQDSFLDDFYREGTARGRFLAITGDRRKKPEKYARIEAMSPLFERGLVYFNLDEKDSPDMKELAAQLLDIEQGSNSADDGPDALEGGVYLLMIAGRTATGGKSKYSKRVNRKY